MLELKYLIIALQLLFIIRFHFELAKMNAFIEPVNTIRRLTNPLVLPLKKIIPVFWAKKFAAIIAGYLLGVVILVGIILFYQGSFAGVFFSVLVLLLLTWIAFLKYGMISFVILSWITLFSGGNITNPLMNRLSYLLEKTFQPLLQPIQRVIPSFGGLDLSPIVFFFALIFIESLIFKLLATLVGS